MTYERKVARGELEAQTEEIKSLRRQLNMIITSRMQQPIPIEYLEYKVSKEESGEDDILSPIKSKYNNNFFSWSSGIFNLIFPLGISNTNKSFNFQTTEIIHV